jgi:general secretion pathway protein M
VKVFLHDGVGALMKDRRRDLGLVASYALAILLLSTVSIYSIAGIWARHQSVSEARAVLSKFERRPSAAGEGRADAARAFLEDETVTLAGAVLLRRVKDAFSERGAKMISSQLDLPTDASDHNVRAQVSYEIAQPQLQKLLYDLEAGMPFLFVDQLVAEPVRGGSGTSSDVLRLTMRISGVWKERR